MSKPYEEMTGAERAERQASIAVGTLALKINSFYGDVADVVKVAYTRGFHDGECCAFGIAPTELPEED